MRFVFLLAMLLGMAASPVCSQVNRVEYFLDYDPGMGNATAVAVSSGNDISSSFIIPSASIPQGYHTLYIRVRDQSARWSIPAARTFYQLPAAGATVAGIEYFIDTDPGAGKATAVPATAGADITQGFTIPLNSLSYGFHSFSVRVRDNAGRWSLTQQKVFFTSNATDTTRISGFQYYFSAGSFVSNTYTQLLPAPATSADLNFKANLSELAPDKEYTLYIYAITNTGIKSLVQKKLVKVCSGEAVKAGFDFIVRGTQAGFIDSSRGTGKYKWKFGDGSEDSVSNPVHSYTTPGVYTAQLIKSNFCNSDTLAKQVVISGISSHYPTRGGNSGIITMLINGVGFTTATRVTLVGAQTISPDTVVALNGNVLQATFNLLNKPAGKYDVRVDFGNNIASLLQSFTIVPDTEGPKLSVDFTGRDAIRRSTEQSFELVIRNTGLVDARLVPVTLVIEGDSNMQVNLKADWIRPAAAGPDFDNMPVYTKPDSLLGKPFNGIAVPVLIPYIKAGEEISYICILKTDADKDLTIRAWPNQPLIGPTTADDVIECASRSLTQLLGAFINNDCAKSIFKGAIENDRIYMATDKTVPQKMGAAVWNLWSSVWGCVPAYRTANRFITLMNNYMKVSSFTNEKIEEPLRLAAVCGKIFYNDVYPVLKKTLRNVLSFDPNEKAGPRTSTTLNHLQGNTPFNYTIYFENKNTATAPAQTVVVIDTLDKTKFDLTTFSLQNFGVGDSLWMLPAGARYNYTTTKNLQRPGKATLLLRTDVKLDTATGVLWWRFLTMDPLTRELINDPLDGFLPPNTIAPKGQGFITYSVQPKKDLAHGTRITNKASIYFDANSPIVTNTFSNTIDLTPPVSRMTALAASTADTSFMVNWGGTDADAGVRSYDVYYAVNSGTFTPWLYDVTITQAMFTGQHDSLYRFYSIAKDWAGNREAGKTTSETSIHIDAQEGQPGNNAAGLKAYPNPATTSVSVAFTVDEPQVVQITLFNMQGKQIGAVGNEWYTTGSHTQRIDMAHLPAGIYMLNVHSAAFEKCFKIIKQ